MNEAETRAELIEPARREAGTIEIEERERYRVKLVMEQIDQREKTLVFCAN